MKKSITEKDLSDLARIMAIDEKTLSTLKSILDVTKVRALLISDEYNREVKTHQYQKKQIIEALMRKHSVSRSVVEQIIYKKTPNKTHFCTRCAAAMSKHMFTRNKGVCNTCIAKEINNKPQEHE